MFMQGQWVSGKSTQGIYKLQASKGVLQFPQQPCYIWGIVVSPNGTIFVPDYYKHQIHVFDAQRNHVRTFGEQVRGGIPCSVYWEV